MMVVMKIVGLKAADWKDCQKVLNDKNTFLKACLDCDFKNMSGKTAALISKTCEDKEFTVENVNKKSRAVGQFAILIHALNEFVKLRPRYLEIKDKLGGN